MTEHATSSPPGKPQLTYASLPPWYRRQKVRTLATWLSFIAFASVIAIWAPHWWRLIQISHYQRQCLSHTFRADELVFEASLSKPEVPPAFIAIPPVYYSRFLRVTGNQTNVGTPVFLHERRTPANERRLVAVNVAPVYGLSWDRHVYTVPNGLGRPDEHWEISPIKLPGFLEQPEQVRVFAGKPDPEDLSHFTIRVELDGKSKTIDGWLQNDDTVRLELRESE